MTDLTITGKVAERLEDIARRENRPIEAVLESLLDRYSQADSTAHDEQDNLWQQEFRAKLYKKARDYWQRTNNQERLSLTDSQLDNQFWLIDHEGIPRLKSEQGTVQLPDDPLETLDALFAESELDDMSITVRETMAANYKKKHEHTD